MKIRWQQSRASRRQLCRFRTLTFPNSLRCKCRLTWLKNIFCVYLCATQFLVLPSQSYQKCFAVSWSMDLLHVVTEVYFTIYGLSLYDVNSIVRSVWQNNELRGSRSPWTQEYSPNTRGLIIPSSRTSGGLRLMLKQFYTDAQPHKCSFHSSWFSVTSCLIFVNSIHSK